MESKPTAMTEDVKPIGTVAAPLTKLETIRTNGWLRFESDEEALVFAYDRMEAEGLVGKGWTCVIAKLPQATHGNCSYAEKRIRLNYWNVTDERIADVQGTILHEIAHALHFYADPVQQAVAFVQEGDVSPNDAAAKFGVTKEQIAERWIPTRRGDRNREQHPIEWARIAVSLGVFVDNATNSEYKHVLQQAWDERNGKRVVDLTPMVTTLTDKELRKVRKDALKKVEWKFGKPISMIFQHKRVSAYQLGITVSQELQRRVDAVYKPQVEELNSKFTQEKSVTNWSVYQQVKKLEKSWNLQRNKVSTTPFEGMY
jgi:hypothetical protein